MKAKAKDQGQQELDVNPGMVESKEMLARLKGLRIDGRPVKLVCWNCGQVYEIDDAEIATYAWAFKTLSCPDCATCLAIELPPDMESKWPVAYGEGSKNGF